MDDTGLAAMLKRLTCPRCRKLYQPTDVLSVDAQGINRNLDVQCQRCRLRVRLTLPVVKRRRGASGTARAPRPGAARLRPTPISEDDVHQVRRLLQDFRGDVRQLLKRLS